MKTFLQWLQTVLLLIGAAFIYIRYLPEIQFVQLPLPVQLIFRTPSWPCGDSRCAAVSPTAYRVGTDAADHSAGITERWCVTYTQVRPNTGRYGRYLRWAHQNGIRFSQVVVKRNGVYEMRTHVYRHDADQSYKQYCSS